MTSENLKLWKVVKHTEEHIIIAIIFPISVICCKQNAHEPDSGKSHDICLFTYLLEKSNHTAFVDTIGK